MKCLAKLVLTDSEISRARAMGHEVDIKRQEDFGYWSEVYSSSVVKIIDFLKTITDLRDYSDEELEDYYVRAI